VTDEDVLRRLEQRLTRASDAAERLIAEAARTARAGAHPGGEDRPPPQGYQAPPPEDGEDRRREDMELLVAFAHRIRDLVPPELQRRLGEALRELLLAVRAVIDWYLERLERRRGAPPEVKDIPIL
jgi:hypothetical protein